jgi:RHS repeat-associated protein
VKRVSNPFRTGETKQWTTNTYDEASRIKEVTLQDGAKILTDYGVSVSGMIGLTKQITDQAGKKRLGISDALGRMVRVIEDPGTGKLNYSTDYTFDTLGNLRKTVQGDQSRYFLHDSLGRLLYAKQPEQDTNGSFSATDAITGNTAWSAKYEYDDNGNITKTTDARGWYVEGTYDHLNRITLRDYSSSSSTPDVDFYYDGKGLGSVPDHSKGKTTKVSSSVSATEYVAFDVFGRVTRTKQITDGVTYGDDANPMTYAYSLSGALIEQTYPSGRKVKLTIDRNGDLAQVQSRKNANYGFATYAGSFSYDAAGNVKKMQLGNGRWETASYNTRLQLTQIGLGSVDSVQDLLKLEYSYNSSGQADNNGSLREQKITVPTVGGSSGFTAIQTYAYDDLNRLLSAQETISGNQTWKQTFTYDRYGNRRFDAGNTTTLGSCTAAVCNPTISTASNRISQSGYSFDPNGSLTVDGNGNQFAYDAENHQKEVKDAATNVLGQYLYDGEGRRVKKVSNLETTIFVYDAGGKLVAEYSTALAQAQQVGYLTTDHLGSPRVISDQNGAITNRKDYTAFGEENFTAQRVTGLGYSSSGEETRKGYTGYERDNESGLEFAQARYYNAGHGRFTSVDPLTASASIRNPQTFNRYSYVLNSPYKFVDPLGLISSSTGACGNGCPNSGPVVDGSAFHGRDATFEHLKTTNELWRGLLNALSYIFSSPVRPAGLRVNSPSDPSSGPATAIGGTFAFGKKEFKGGTDPFGNVVIDVYLDALDAIDQASLTGVGLAKNEKQRGQFTINVDIDLGSAKNAPIDTKFAEREEVSKPGKINADGSISQPVLEIVKGPVANSSIVRTSDSNVSNVRVSDQGKVTFVGTENGRTRAVFRGTFNYDPGPNRTASFRLAVVTKRSDYRSPETSNITVRLNLIRR